MGLSNRSPAAMNVERRIRWGDGARSVPVTAERRACLQYGSRQTKGYVNRPSSQGKVHLHRVVGGTTSREGGQTQCLAFLNGEMDG
jgi:hypothetical protein